MITDLYKGVFGSEIFHDSLTPCLHQQPCTRVSTPHLKIGVAYFSSKKKAPYPLHQGPHGCSCPISRQGPVLIRDLRHKGM